MKNETANLKAKIAELQAKCARDERLLREQVDGNIEKLKFTNLIKGAFHEATAAPEWKANSLSALVAIGSGLLSKKLVVGESSNPIKMVLGALLQNTVANLVTQHADTIALGFSYLGRQFSKDKEPATQP